MSRRTLASLAGAVLALLITGAPAAAQTNIYWNGTGTTWNSTSDWWTTPGGATPVGSFSGSSIIANFNATSVTSPQALTLDANQVIQGLVFTGTDVGGETISSGAGTNSLTIGASGIVDNFGSGVDTIAANLVLSSSQSWSNYSANTLTVSGNISQSGPGLGLTFAGAGTVALAGSNTYSGPTVLANGLGSLLLDFTAATAPADNIINNGVTITNNNITSGSGLVLGGGTLRINVSLSSANNQAFNGTTVNAGQSMLTITNTGAGSVNLALGAITRNVGSGVNFNQSAGFANSFYTTTANPTFSGGSNTILGGWAVFTQVLNTLPNTWATSAGDGTNAGLITDFESYTTADGATPFTAGADIDNVATNAAAVASSMTINSLRFNAAAGVTSSIAQNATLTIASGGILVTPAVGANTETIQQATAPAFITSGNGTDLIINQYNPATPDRSLTISARTTDNGATPIGLTKNGPGQLNLGTSNATFSGNVYINAGTVQTGSGFNGANNPTPTTASSALGIVGAGTGSRSITVGPGAILNFTTNNVLTGNSASLANSAANTPAIVINGGTFFSSRYNAIGNITLNSGAVLNQSATDGSGTNAYQGFQFLGSITSGGTSGSSIIAGSSAGNQLFPVAGGGTTFNVGATGSSGPDLTVSARLVDASGDYNGIGAASSLIKNGAGTMRVSGASTYSGGTTVNAGRLTIASSSTALGTGPITLAGGSLRLQGIATGSIGVQFGANVANGGTGLTSAQSAGVPAVAMSNWNVTGAANQGAPLTLVNNNGVATTASVTWSGAADIWHTGATGGTADTTLMSGYLDSNGTTSPSVTFSGVPYSQYKAYVYVGSDGNNRGGTTSNSQNATTYYWSTNTNGLSFGSPPLNYVTTTNTNSLIAPNANYLVFDGLNNIANDNQTTFTSGFGKGAISGNGNTGITAIELVNTVPNAPLVMANNLTLTTDSTIDVTGFSSDTISGQLSMGTNTLSVTGGSTGAGAGYTLSLGTVGGVSLSGNPTFDVANNGSGVGSLALGALSDGGTARTITKQNAGTLNLTAGGTLLAGSQVNVNAGTLRVTSGSNPATGSAPITIFTGAMLAGPNTGGGVGTIASAVTVNTGGGLAGGSPTGTVILNLSGGLTLQSGTTSAITLSVNPNGTADPTQAIFATSGGAGTSSLLVGGSHVISLSGSPPVQANSTYDLFSYTGAQFTSGQFANFSLGGSLPESNFLNYALVNGSNQIDLAVTFKGLTWTGRTGGTGTANGSWDVSTSNNWANSTPAASTYTDGQGVLFGDKNPLSASNNVGTSSVAIQGSGLSPGTMLFTNSGASAGGVDYTFSGGSINGTTGVTLNGAGGVTLQSANAFSGAVSINAGHLQVQNGTALGNSSGVTVTSGTALELASGSGTTTVYGSRADNTGTIGLILNGAGRTGNAAGALNSINGFNFYAGPITIGNAGATIDSNSNANGDQLILSGGISLPATATLSIGAVGGVTLSGGITTGAGSTLSIAGGGAVAANTAPISGGAGIVYAGTGTGSLTLAADNSYSGSTTINSNSVILNTANGLGNSTGVLVAGGAGGALVLNNVTVPQTFGTTPAVAGGTIPLTLNGAGNASAAGALASTMGSNTYAGAITLGSSASIASTSTTAGDGLNLPGGIAVPSGARLTVVGPGSTTIGTAGSSVGSITGAGALTVNATTGTVTLPGANSYSNGTKLSSGTLAVANNSALGSGAVTLSGGTLQLQAIPVAAIGINFPGTNNDATDNLPPATVAGVVPQTNWNNVTATGTALHASNGVITGASVAFTTGGVGPWDVSATTGTNPNALNGDQLLNNGGIYGGAINTTVSGVNYPAGYKVFVHLLTDHGANLSVALTPTGGTALPTVFGNTPLTPNGTGYVDGVSSGFTYTQATGTSSSPTQNATYAEFDLPGSVTGFTVAETLLAGSAASNAAMDAIQIVTPTPATALSNSVTIDDANGPVTIDVTGPQSASLTSNVAFGNAAGGAIQLNVTGAGTGAGSNYALSLGGGVTLSGTNTNYVFDVAASSLLSGAGTLSMGPLTGGGTARTITLQNAGTVVLTSPGTLIAGSTVNVGPVAGGNGGNLRVTNTSGSASGSAVVNVNSGGTLLGSTSAGQGFISGAVTLNNGATIVGGSGATLTLSGGLTLQAGSSSAFTLGSPANGTANPALAFVATSGGGGASSLAVGGGHTINVTGAPPVQLTSSYDLFSYTGTRLTTGQFGNFSLGGSLPQSNIFNYSLVNGNKQVDLVVTLIPLTWTGLDNGTGPADGSWDVGTSTNWANSIPAATTYADNTLPVVFGDKNPLSPGGTGAVGTSTVTIQPAGVSPLAVVFTNTGAAAGGVDYTITAASGSINDNNGGPTSLFVNGTGGVILQAPNTFTGPVLINSGHLQLQNTLALGNSSGVTVGAGGALELISGSGTSDLYGPSQNGSGTVALTLNGTGLAASPAGALNSMNGINTYSGPISVGASGVATIASNSNANGDQLTLSGGVNLTAGATLSIGGVGPTIIATLPVSVGPGDGTVNSTGAVALTISGGAAIASGSTLTLGGATSTTVDTTAIGGPGSLAYSGTGTGSLILAIDNTYSGSTTINSNSVVLSTPGGLGNSSGATVVGGAGGALVLNNTSGNPMTFSGVPLALNGAGSVTAPGALASIAGNNTYGGLISVGSSNAAQIASVSTAPGDSLVLGGGVNLPTGSSLTLAGPGNTVVNPTLATTVSGGGALLVKTSGAGTVTVTGNNTYGGGTTVQQGTLAVIGTNTALGAGTVTLSGGKLQLQGGPGAAPSGRSIGINFEGGQTAGTVGVTPLATTDSAGVLPQTNWNNVSSINPVVVSTTVPGQNANIDSPTAGSLVDNNGNVVAGGAISFLSNNPWAVSATVPTTGDAKLMNGYADLNFGGTNRTTVTVSGVPYASYSVYAYVGSDQNLRIGHGQVDNGAAIYFSTSDSPFVTYTQATATTQAAAVASNYLVFQEVAGTSFTYSESGDTNNVGLHGIQIVDTTGNLALTNGVAVTANSTIDVTGAAGAAISGPLSIGTNTLFVTGGSTGANAPYSLGLGAATLSGNPTFDVANNGSGGGTLTLASLNDGGAARTITKTNAGTLEIQGASTLTTGTLIKANVGSLRFNNTSGPATVGTGVTAIVASGATLELAGNVSDLSSPSPPAARVNVTNNSTQSSGGSLLVSGTNQQVGAIRGTGDTVVIAGASLTANSIVQNALVIGGDSTHAGLVTIDASDASGNPLASSGGLAVAGSVASSGAFASGSLSPSGLLAGASGSATVPSLGSSPAGSVNLGGSNAAVPEPSTLLLLVLGSLACLSSALRRRRNQP